MKMFSRLPSLASAGRMSLGMLALLAALGSIAVGCRPPPAASGNQSAQLYVTSDPAGAALACNDQPVGVTPITLNVKPGMHLLSAAKSGYEQQFQTVIARAGERIAVELKLPPVRGILLVHSDPANADVEINGVYYGKTPLLLPNFPLGRHQLRASAGGYLPRVVEIDLADRTPVKTFVRLAPDAARLTVDSSPAGAEVLLDGASLGKTPCRQARVAAGRHVLEVKLPGYAAHREEFEAKVGVDHKVNAALVPLPGRLLVHSQPVGARVYINGQYRGDTPLVMSNLAAGSYAIRAELAGYAPAQGTSTVPQGGETAVEFKLERNSGAILVSTEPPGVTVFLDGEKRGVTVVRGEERISEQLTLDLVPAGRHIIQLARDGYFDVMHTKIISAGQTVIIHEKMRMRPVEFVPTTMIRTGDGPEYTFRGIIRERFGNGDIKMELEPGIFRTFRAAEIREIAPLPGN